MSFALRAVGFLVSHQAGWRPRVHRSERTLRAQGREFQADVYRPRSGGRTRASVVFVHGYTALANRDPRVVDFCRGLTLFDATVVVPRFDEIVGFVVDARCVSAIEAALEAVLGDAELAPRARTGVFCASLASLFCLGATARPAVADRIGAVCLAGGLYTVAGLLDVLFRQDDHLYGRDIVLLHHLERMLGSRPPRIEEALRAALLDNSLERDPPELPGLLARMPAEERLLVEQLRGSAEFRRGFAERIRPELERIHAECMQLDGLRAPVVLLHGAGDALIAASESVALAAELVRKGRQVRLDVSPLIGHMDAKAIRPQLLSAVVRLIGSFATFFERAAC